MGLPRYIATASADDPETTVWQADELLSPHEKGGPICVLQCGRPSAMAAELGRQLRKRGRRGAELVVPDRATAQSNATLAKLAEASSVWVLADDLFETFFTVFATRLAFLLRGKARDGFPVIGVGGGALALGGLLLASRVCHQSQYGLVSGLGWAPRVFVDGELPGSVADTRIAHTTVRSLPGLLGLQLGRRGGVRVEAGRVESIGSEPVLMLGTDGSGSLVMLPLEPGKTSTIAPPPFAPFERGLLPPETLRALATERRPIPAQQRPHQAPAPTVVPPRRAPAPKVAEPDDRDRHAQPGSGRHCPMCKQIHAAEPKLELAA